MLQKFDINTSKTKNYAEAIAENNKYSRVAEGVDGDVVEVTDDDLKCVPKSDYIYNEDILTESYLETLSVSEKNKLILELQRKNKSVREDNEQFRQKNFVMYMRLRKLAPNEV
jgi:hypothetical protein